MIISFTRFSSPILFIVFFFQLKINKYKIVSSRITANAIKYSPSADKIIITTKFQRDGIQLSVQDFGIGIPQIEKKNVFNQFYRVSGDNQSTYPGMGIGLYISSEIILKHNGKIWVDSSLAKGSIFYIWLPISS